MRLAAVGDVTAFHCEPESGHEFAGPVLADFDVVFAQNERLYSRTTAIPDVGFTELTDPDHVAALKLGHFDVISFASNHCYDLGRDVFMETHDALRKQGFAVIGAGRDIAQARQPAVFERDGARIGFLGYCSVLRPGYEAGPDKPGAVPMRAHTLYQQIDYQPGTAPKILTFADRDDLRALIEDIKAAKAKTDFLAVSLHWGIHLVKCVLADYEAEVAHAAIDAGADTITVASFRPVVINTRAQPQPMTASEPGFTQVLDYVREVTAVQRPDTRFHIDGDRVIVSGT